MFNLNKAMHLLKGITTRAGKNRRPHGDKESTCPVANSLAPHGCLRWSESYKEKSAHNKLNKAYLGVKITIALKNLNTGDLYKKITRLDFPSNVRVN